MNPVLKLGGILVLLVIGFEVTVAVLPHSWLAPPGGGLGTFGVLVGCLGAALLAVVALVGLKALSGSPREPAGRP
ncbi:MAG TPA: hypothetical protein VGO55_09160 [Allosphingosinicella sp.]|jgi:hypothetical protein|nr:hypothetical protein [Allosphingosinicella sp.]